MNSEKDSDKKHFTIALAGNPNVGKSTLFNQLTGLKQHTGNWTGKTVSTAKGRFYYKDALFEITDIPGTYSLMSSSEEERIARDYLCFENYDLCVIVADACAIEKSLNLILQYTATIKRAVLCVNLIDEAKKRGIEIDFDELSLQLGIPCIPTAARSKNGLSELCDTIYNVCNENKRQYMPTISMPEAEERILQAAQKLLPDNLGFDRRWLCIKLLDGDDSFIESLKNKTDILGDRQLEKSIKAIKSYASADTADHIQQSILSHAQRIFTLSVKEKYKGISRKDILLDRLFTSKYTGIPIMLLLLGAVFWLTIIGANYPSRWLSGMFSEIEVWLCDALGKTSLPMWVEGLFVKGVFRTVGWVVAVMLPPMAIFFPLFTLLEDFGFLPRLAFNMDNLFCKSGSNGKQALTMCMGLGCNACAVTNSRIISSKREKLIAIITNSLTPCNGRFPTIISIITMFLCFEVKNSSLKASIILLFVIFVSFYTTLNISKLLSRTLLKGEKSLFTLELPPYRAPQIAKTIVRSVFDRTLFVLGRAIAVSAPAGVIIWLLANTDVGNTSLLLTLSQALDPLGRFMGLDGVILLAFILGFPANEIVLPIALMAYTNSGLLSEASELSQLRAILVENGWNVVTAICTMIFCIFHFPCSTTSITIYKETKSVKWTLISIFLPTILGFLLCSLVSNVARLLIAVI